MELREVCDEHITTQQEKKKTLSCSIKLNAESLMKKGSADVTNSFKFQKFV